MTLDSFFPYVLPEVPGCPDPSVRLALVSAAIEFCQETLAWTELQDPVTLADNLADYDLDAPVQAICLTVRDVWCGSRRLRPVSMQQLQELLPDWPSATGSEPSYYNQAVERSQIRVFPKPLNTTGQTLVMRAAYIPVAGATSLPDFLGQRYMEVIASGAKGRLMLMPGLSWSNPELGSYHKQLFSDGTLNARIREAHDRVPGSITVRPRSFGF